MKTFSLIILFLAGLSCGQSIVTIGGQTSWGDTLRWGDTDDSTHSLLVRGNAAYRDSAGTWVAITTDSCSKAVRIDRGSQLPVWKYELEYEVRASSGNTDSTQVVYRIDTRYCGDSRTSRNCGAWTVSGRHAGYADVAVLDTVLSTATGLGVTWRGTRHLFNPGGGNQLRACIDSHQAGGATGDSTFFRRHILRLQ